MKEASGECLLWRTIERLDDAERQLLKPEPTGLGNLIENLEESWRELCGVELVVRVGGPAPGSAAAAGLERELEEVRGRVSRLVMLLDHAREMVAGCQVSHGGSYQEDGGSVAPGQRVLRHLEEEG